MLQVVLARTVRRAPAPRDQARPLVSRGLVVAVNDRTSAFELRTGAVNTSGTRNWLCSGTAQRRSGRGFPGGPMHPFRAAIQALMAAPAQRDRTAAQVAPV